eukprot:scaffold2340_cov113-Isochrysis_galbana.AAC.8
MAVMIVSSARATTRRSRVPHAAAAGRLVKSEGKFSKAASCGWGAANARSRRESRVSSRLALARLGRHEHPVLPAVRAHRGASKQRLALLLPGLRRTQRGSRRPLQRVAQVARLEHVRQSPAERLQACGRALLSLKGDKGAAGGQREGAVGQDGASGVVPPQR